MRPLPPLLLLTLAPAFLAAQPAATPATPATPPPAQPAPAATDDLFQLGQQLFDQLAPPEIKAQYDFPSKQRWDEFAARLQKAFESDDLRALAEYAPQARLALPALQLFPEYSDYADWLKTRLDELEAAEQIVAPKPTPPTPKPPSTPTAPSAQKSSVPIENRVTERSDSSASKIENSLPHYDLFLARARASAAPSRAAALLPLLRAAFIAEGIPPELVWLAEAESTFNPSARSPVGARGLYQLMPDTAKELGLSTFLPDDRTDPEKSARAAARLLRANYEKFGSWPLALAAYNAGAGRVTRLLEKTSTKTYAGIAAALPAETRLYVPKVCALVAVRGGMTPENIPAPNRS
ncbi:MAG: lytic transglycosylase domain-containing protein [Undibacterium sp.]|nr:lytic transglycosylase domain-containing protein [Opitutaceae bacterium]